MFRSKRERLNLSLEAQKSRSFWQDVGSRFIRNRKAVLGLILLSLIVLMCLYGVFFIDYENQVTNVNVEMKLEKWIMGIRKAPRATGH